MTRKHYVLIARAIAESDTTKAVKEQMVEILSPVFCTENNHFSKAKFKQAVLDG